MKRIFVAAVVLFIAALAGSCSKKNKNNDLPDGKQMKFILSAEGLQSADDLFFVFTGATGNDGTSTIFKINGEVQSNAIDVIITKEQLMAGTVTVESVVPLYVVSGNINGSSGTQGHTFSYLMKSEVGGKAQPDKSGTISTSSYTQQFSFN